MKSVKSEQLILVAIALEVHTGSRLNQHSSQSPHWVLITFQVEFKWLLLTGKALNVFLILVPERLLLLCTVTGS